MSSNVIVGTLLIVCGVYALAVHYFRPEAFAPKMTPTLLRILCAVMIIGGLLAAFSGLIFRNTH